MSLIIPNKFVYKQPIPASGAKQEIPAKSRDYVAPNIESTNKSQSRPFIVITIGESIEVFLIVWPVCTGLDQ